MKLILKAAIIFCGIWAVPVLASSFYTHLAVAMTRIDISGTETKPFIGALKLGFEFADNFALEGQYGVGADDDEYLDQTLEVDSMAAGFLRISSGSSYNNVRLYLLAGYAQFELSVNGASPTSDDKYDGFAWGIGAEEFLKSVKNLAFVAEYYQYYDQKEVSIDAISLGFRYRF